MTKWRKQLEWNEDRHRDIGAIHIVKSELVSVEPWRTYVQHYQF